MNLKNLEKQVLLDVSGEAASDLSQYTFVKEDGNGDIVAAGDGEVPLGVVTRQFGSGEEATVVTHGFVPVVVGTAGTLAAGDSVAVDANGQADAGTSGDAVAGILLTAPSADGDIVMALVNYGTAVTEDIA